jgi:hypothetical protein
MTVPIVSTSSSNRKTQQSLNIQFQEFEDQKVFIEFSPSVYNVYVNRLHHTDQIKPFPGKVTSSNFIAFAAAPYRSRRICPALPTIRFNFPINATVHRSRSPTSFIAMHFAIAATGQVTPSPRNAAQTAAAAIAGSGKSQISINKSERFAGQICRLPHFPIRASLVQNAPQEQLPRGEIRPKPQDLHEIALAFENFLAGEGFA